MSEKPFFSSPGQRNHILTTVLVAAVVCWIVFNLSSPRYPTIIVNESVDITEWADASSVPRTGSGSVSDTPEHIKLVPFEAHIMSKCPDAQVCLKEMVLPAMQRVYDKVDFTLSFIGTPTENDGVDCKHGPAECMGNIIELCAAHIYGDPKIYLGFTMCLTRDYQDIPDRSLVEDCALEHGIDFQKLNDCTSNENGIGIGMLRNSVRRTIRAGVTKSCTVRVNNEIYCVHDDEWTECPNGPGVNDLVIAIEKLYNAGSR